MSPLSLRSCFICSQLTSFLNGGSVDTADLRFWRNVNICQRFSTLVTRYLNIKSSISSDSKHTLNNRQKILSKGMNLCDNCVPVAESFCQMYDVWVCLQLEMNRCLEEIVKLILLAKDANNVNQGEHIKQEIPSASSELQCCNKLETKNKQCFHETFLKQVKEFRSKSFPQLTLKKEKYIPTSSPAVVNFSKSLKNEVADPATLTDLKVEVSDECYDDTDDFEFTTPEPFESQDMPTNDHDSNFSVKVRKDAGRKEDEETLSNLTNNLIATKAPLQKAVSRKKGSNKTGCCSYVKACSKDKPHSCIMCWKYSARSNWNLYRHLRTHIKEKPYFCKECFQEFSLELLLVEHKNSFHGGESFKCRFCLKQFACRSNCFRHEKSMHKKGFATVTRNKTST